MTLYSASLKDIAQPVATKKEKKPATEKQLAALAKAQETKKRKREEADLAKQQLEDEIENKKKEIEVKEAEIAEKKRLQAEKRKAKKLEKLAPLVEEEVVVEPEVKQDPEDLIAAKKAFEKVEKKRIAYEKRVANKKKKLTQETDLDQAVDEAMVDIKSEPPVWFKQYVDGVKNEEVMVVPKKSKKEFKKEAVETASSSWNNGLTRDCIQNEVDNHLSKMYNMIFAGRRMK